MVRGTCGFRDGFPILVHMLLNRLREHKDQHHLTVPALSVSEDNPVRSKKHLLEILLHVEYCKGQSQEEFTKVKNIRNNACD